MCVAAIIESRKPIPETHLRAMERENPHGAGIAWIDHDRVRFSRGLTWADIHAIQGALPRPFMMHFRWATRGGIDPWLTHPFPLGMEAFTADLEGTTDAVIIHNGTWSAYAAHVPPGINLDTVSDTQVAAYVARTDETILDQVSWANAIMRAAGLGRADIVLRGDWSEHEGNLYSNLHWLPGRRRSFVSHSLWDLDAYSDTALEIEELPRIRPGYLNPDWEAIDSEIDRLLKGGEG